MINKIKRAINKWRANRAKDYCIHNRLKLAAEFKKCNPEVLECNLMPMLEGINILWGGPESSCRLKYGDIEVLVEFVYTAARFSACGDTIAQIVGKGIPVEWFADSYSKVNGAFYPTFTAYDDSGREMTVRVLSAKF